MSVLVLIVLVSSGSEKSPPTSTPDTTPPAPLAGVTRIIVGALVSVTVTVFVALLLVVLGSIVLLETLAVSVITLPAGVPAFTITTNVTVPEELAARLGFEQLAVPVPPTGGLLQVHPAVALTA